MLGPKFLKKLVVMAEIPSKIYLRRQSFTWRPRHAFAQFRAEAWSQNFDSKLTIFLNFCQITVRFSGNLFEIPKKGGH